MRLFFAYTLTALFLTLSLAHPAKAINVTVSGTTYDVTLQTSTTYNLIEGLLTSTPWFGNQTLAEDIAAEYFTVTGGDFGISGGTSDGIAFSIADLLLGVPTGDQRSVVIFEDNGTPSIVDFGKDNTLSSQNAYAVGSIVATVPEINGASLAQALFVLMALALFLHTRRRNG